ncbi:HlyD family type I secretion periplasmic adaptor subunit [Halarcobacter bivalviorum]|uniref:HlyD family type I secretion periplasmic adaptor subunit n=1 Tax=Halarcobacter bivalviorum TaxID=663364 RepID=UPI00100B1AE3|nr:HlyD family type I secretion periplasmic adaptor subunit [Halarcobacter bivalviorum]RXK04805.1 secretion protein HylD [Halarcobacter bivalviorum]
MNSNNDVRFVHNLYGQSNERPKFSVDFLFMFIVVFLIVLIIWASFAEIDELAKGEGKVIPSSKIQTIQSLDGGLIEEILVKSGEEVKKGQPLIKIDTTRFQASLEESQESYNQWLAMRERLQVESNINLDKEVPELKFSDEVKKIAKDYIESENVLFKNRIKELKSSVNVLDSQKRQKKQELKEIEEEIRQLDTKIKLVKIQRNTIKKLVQTGIKSKVDLITIEKEYQQFIGDLKAAELSIPRTNYAITEIENKREEKITQFKTAASKELQRIEVEINKAQARLVSETDKVDKTVIKSSVDGIVKEIYMNTLGGVVQSGMNLLDIIPNSDTLLIEAKIDPKDIAFINPLQRAIVKVSAYDFTIYGGLEGQIVEISADSIIDKDSKDAKSYYKVIIKTEKNYLEKNGVKLPIIPGMIATVDIITGKKTIMDYILKPILKIKQNSLHEK